MKKDKKPESAALLRRKAKESIKECEERYRTLFEVMDEGFCVVEMIYDPDGKAIDYRFVEINPAFEKNTGLQQAPGKTIRQMVPNYDMHWFEIYGKVARTGESIRFEAPAIAMQRYYDVFAFRIGGDGSQRVGILFNDITERKRTEEELRNSEERFKAIYENAPVLMDAFDKDGRCIMWNKECEKTYGWTIEEINSHDEPLSLFYPDPKIRKQLKKLVTSNPEKIFREWHPQTKDGTVLTCMWANYVLLDGTVMNLGFDITERKLAEEDLRKSEEKYRTLTENVNLGIYRNTVGPEGKFVEANPAIIGMFGYKSKKEFLAVNVSDLYQNQEDRNNFNDKILKEGFVRNKELRLKKKDGSLIVGSVSAVAVNDGQGYVKYYDGIIDDITERKQMLEKTQFLAHTIKSILEIVTITDLEDRLIFVNHSFCDIYGYTNEEIIGQHVKILSSPNNPPELLKDILEHSHKDSWKGELLNLTKAGREFPIFLQTSQIINEKGKIIGLVGISKDITERKQAEEALREREALLFGLFNNMTSGAAIYHVINKGEKGSDYIIKYFNKASCKIENIKPEQLIGKNLFDLRPNIDEYGLIPIFKKVWETSEPEFFPAKVYKDDKFNNYYENYVFKIPSGEIVAIYNDVTERKQAELSLRESEEKYRNLFNNSEVGMFRSRFDGSEILEFNKKYLKIFNFTHDYVRGIPSVNFWADKRERDEMVKLLEAEGQVTDFECGLLNKQREVRRCILSLYLYREQGILEGSLYDITERRKAEEDLLKSKKKLELLNINLNEVREDERMLISRELHDELGQSLTAVKMDLSSIRENTRNIKSVTPKLDKTLKLVDGIIKDVQRISSELRPGILDDLGLTSAIEWYCEEFEARTGIKCELNLEEIRFKNPQKITGVYRILQESLTNIARHSEAKNVIVRLEQIKEDINLVIRDDGIGIPEEKMESNSSLGLIGIRERIKQFNGRIDIESVKDKGTEIRVIIPVDD